MLLLLLLLLLLLSLISQSAASAGWMGTRLTRARTLEHQVNGGMVRKGTKGN